MHFYVADPDDPIIRAYQGVFPTLFEPIDAMPADLRAHLRVPEELFNVQTQVFGRYHVTDPLQFFRQRRPVDRPDRGHQRADPAVRGLLRRDAPAGRDRGRVPAPPADGPDQPAEHDRLGRRPERRRRTTAHGQVYRFPADTTIFGPAQIEARIDQDPIISAQVSLWNQSGSKVIRGNLIVVPLDDSLIYLQPVYLQSTGSAFPEFKRIVVASPRQVVWADTLGDALRLLLAAEAGGAARARRRPRRPGPSPGPGASPTPTPGPGTARRRRRRPACRPTSPG